MPRPYTRSYETHMIRFSYSIATGAGVSAAGQEATGCSAGSGFGLSTPANTAASTHSTTGTAKVTFSGIHRVNPPISAGPASRPTYPSPTTRAINAPEARVSRLPAAVNSCGTPPDGPSPNSAQPTSDSGTH